MKKKKHSTKQAPKNSLRGTLARPWFLTGLIFCLAVLATVFLARIQANKVLNEPAFLSLNGKTPLMQTADSYYYLRLTQDFLLGVYDSPQTLRPGPRQKPIPLLVVITATIHKLTAWPVEKIAFYLPPILGTLSILGILAWGMNLGGWVTACLASLLFLTSPYWLMRSGVGYFDTDCLIPFFIYFFPYCLYKGLTASTKKTVWIILAVLLLPPAYFWWKPGFLLCLAFGCWSLLYPLLSWNRDGIKKSCTVWATGLGIIAGTSLVVLALWGLVHFFPALKSLQGYAQGLIRLVSRHTGLGPLASAGSTIEELKSQTIWSLATQLFAYPMLIGPAFLGLCLLYWPKSFLPKLRLFSLLSAARQTKAQGTSQGQDGKQPKVKKKSPVAKTRGPKKHFSSTNHPDPLPNHSFSGLPKGSAFFLFPYLGTLGLALLNRRFSILCLGLTCLGAGFFISWVTNKLLQLAKNRHYLWLKLFLGLSLVLFTFMTINTASKNFFVPYPISRDFETLAQVIKQRTPQDTLIWSWWDYGYYWQYRTRRATFFDGGSQDELRLLVAALPMGCSDSLLAANWIKFFTAHPPETILTLKNKLGSLDKAVKMLCHILSHPDQDLLAVQKKLGLHNPKAYFFPKAQATLVLPLHFLTLANTWDKFVQPLTLKQNNRRFIFQSFSKAACQVENGELVTSHGNFPLTKIMLYNSGQVTIKKISSQAPFLAIWITNSPYIFLANQALAQTMAFKLLFPCSPETAGFKTVQTFLGVGGVWQIY